MAKKNFLLLSLEDNKAKKIANVVGNASCKKILDHLAEKEATESQLSEKLSIPISTVHYNLKHLMDAGLVSAEEFHYSKKGKEINHYKLANKYIIIAPKSTYGLKEKLKSILPVAAIVAGTAGAIQWFTGSFSKVGTFAATGVSEQVARKAVEDVMISATEEAAVEAVPQAAQQTAQAVTYVSEPSIAMWFLLGALFALVIYLVVDKIRNRNK